MANNCQVVRVKGYASWSTGVLLYIIFKIFLLKLNGRNGNALLIISVYFKYRGQKVYKDHVLNKG